MLNGTRLRVSIAFAGLALLASPASALLPRTFVASFGSDANPCTLTLPCRSFAAAIGQTSAGGEVIVKDTAGYGTVTITQSVSIIVPAGVYAGITVSGVGTGVTVNAPAGKVMLRGLTINGSTTAQYGTWLQAGAQLVVDRCVVENVHDGSIYSTAPGSAMTVVDTFIRDTIFGPGVWVKADTRTLLERVRIVRSHNVSLGRGVFSDDAANVTIKDSLIAANESTGVFVRAASGSTTAGTIDNSVISDNDHNGIEFHPQVAANTAVNGSVTRSTITRTKSGYAIVANSNPPAPAIASAVGNLISHSAGMVTPGTGQIISARDNTFADTVTTLDGGLFSVVHTVRGADGLPSNAGEKVPPVGNNVVPVNAF